MNPSSNDTPGIGLPPPSGAQDAVAGSGQPATPTVQGYSVSQQSIPMQGATDDESGVLDEQWVERAKAIVDQTKSDPFLESKELSKIKAGFLKARYNKDIKVSEDTPR